MKQLTADLGAHLNDRVRQLVNDTIDTSKRMGLTPKECAILVSSVLAANLAEVCITYKMPADIYAMLCSSAFHDRPKPPRRAATK